MDLGGNISLEGFGSREYAEMIVIKKIVGQYARKISDANDGYESLKLSLKEVHGGRHFEIHARVKLPQKELFSEATDRNLFIALDSALKKLISQL